MRVLRNLSKETIVTNYNTRTVVVSPKSTYTTNDDKEANYLLETFGFLRDETKTIKYPVGKIKKTYGKKVEK